MRNTNKKGFTIVELVIVVAVIAILAAVLIPTFSSIIKKANSANDTVVAKNMNTALAEYSALNGKPETFDEVLAAIEEAGYVLANLNAKAQGNLYGWDKTNNQIVYIDAEGKTIYQNVDFVAADLQFVVADSSVALPEGFKGNPIVDMTKPEGPKALKAALEDGKSVTLVNDVLVDAEIIIPEGCDVTLDLGGFKYTTTQLNAGTDSQTSKYIKVSEGASLTITNGTFEGRGVMNYGTLTIGAETTINALDLNGGGCVRNKPGATLVIEGGEFNVLAPGDYYTHGGGAAGVYNDGGTVTIKGGTFTSVSDAYLISNVGGTVTIEGGTFTAHRGALYTGNGETVVNGGTFEVNADSNDGCTVCHVGTGSTTLNGGEFTHVVSERVYRGEINK